MGVNDLCGSFGIPYEVGYDSKIIQDAVDKVIDAGNKYNKAVIYSPINDKSIDLAKKMIAKGVPMMLVGNDIGGMVKYHQNLQQKIKSKL